MADIERDEKLAVRTLRLHGWSVLRVIDDRGIDLMRQLDAESPEGKAHRFVLTTGWIHHLGITNAVLGWERYELDTLEKVFGRMLLAVEDREGSDRVLADVAAFLDGLAPVINLDAVRRSRRSRAP